MKVTLDALSAKIDNAVAALNANTADKAALQAQLDQANADLAAAQAQVDALAAKLP